MPPTSFVPLTRQIVHPVVISEWSGVVGNRLFHLHG